VGIGIITSRKRLKVHALNALPKFTKYPQFIMLSPMKKVIWIGVTSLVNDVIKGGYMKLYGHHKRMYLIGRESFTEALSAQIREAQEPLTRKVDLVLFGIFVGVVVTAAILAMEWV